MSEIFDRALQAHRRGDYEAAVRGYSEVSHLRSARHNLGIALRELGRNAEAERALRSVLAAFPDDAASSYSLSMALLAQGKYAEGWALYEARRKMGYIWAADAESPAPEWKGEDLAGRRLVVCAEQGYGDQLMFARYLPLLRARGAEVTVGCNGRLRPLFASLGYGVTPYAPGLHRLPECDAWMLMGSAPHRLAQEAPPAPLVLAPRRGGGGVGVVPSGNPTHAHDHRRSLGPAQAARLLALGRDLRPEATGVDDFRQSAELFAGLDLVITVDTAAAHLAGSLGVPTWVLIADVGADWRWQRDRTDSPWYPSARLFRQGRGEGWDVVLAQIEAGLAGLRAAGRMVVEVVRR